MSKVKEVSQIIFLSAVAVIVMLDFATTVGSRRKLETIEKRIEVNSNSGQFDVGAFWGAKAVELYIANKQQASYNDVVLQAKAMHSAAVLRSIDEAMKKTQVPAEEAELKTPKKSWWPFGKKDKVEEETESK